MKVSINKMKGDVQDLNNKIRRGQKYGNDLDLCLSVLERDNGCDIDEELIELLEELCKLLCSVRGDRQQNPSLWERADKLCGVTLGKLKLKLSPKSSRGKKQKPNRGEVPPVFRLPMGRSHAAGFCW